MVATCSVTFASNASSKLLIGNQILLISGQMFSEQRFFAPRTLLRILQLFVGRGDQLPCHPRACNSASRPSGLLLVRERTARLVATLRRGA